MLTLTEFVPLAAKFKRQFLLAIADVPAGEPCDLNGDLERFDFHNHLTGCEDGVFMVHVKGDSMEDEIFHGDWLIVNTNLQPKAGDKVVFCRQRFIHDQNLRAVQKRLAPDCHQRKISAALCRRKRTNVKVFGVVTYVIHQLKKI